MIKIYGSPRTSAGRCYLVLEEIGLPYEAMPVDMMHKREHKLPAYLQLNPNGKVPCLVDDDLALWESIAINRYLAEKYKPELLGRDLKTRAQVAQWSTWSQVELQPPMIDIVIQTVFTPAEKRNAGVIESAHAALPPKLAVLDAYLKDKSYLVDERLSLADFDVASVVNITNALKIPRTSYAHLDSWFNRIGERPAYHKWMEMRKG